MRRRSKHNFILLCGLWQLEKCELPFFSWCVSNVWKSFCRFSFRSMGGSLKGPFTFQFQLNDAMAFPNHVGFHEKDCRMHHRVLYMVSLKLWVVSCLIESKRTRLRSLNIPFGRYLKCTRRIHLHKETVYGVRFHWKRELNSLRIGILAHRRFFNCFSYSTKSAHKCLKMHEAWNWICARTREKTKHFAFVIN